MIRECLEVLQRLPDFDNLPLPEAWGAEFNIPITPNKTADLNKIINKFKTRDYVEIRTFEEKGPLPGGVREVQGEEQPLAEVIVKTVFDSEELPALEEVLPTVSTGVSKAEEQTTISENGENT
jgi:hypothetical protein